MTWVRIESNFLRHRKVIELPLAAKMLFVGGLCYAAENGTDGHIRRSALRVLAAELDVKATVVAHLEDAGLWHKQADGWDIHDYLVYQPSAEQERQRRQETADRVKAWRERKEAMRNGSRNAVTSGVTDGVRNGRVTLSPNPNPNPNPNPVPPPPPVENLVAEPRFEEEESSFHIEARRRLFARQGEPVNNPQAWVETTAKRLEAEGWSGPVMNIPKAHPANHSRPDCAECDGLALVEVEGGYESCPRCLG